MPVARRALMLVNPNARRGREAIDPVLDRLRDGGLDVYVERFETREEVARDIAARGADFDMVVVCGGDGTINSAAMGVLETGLPMGIIPMGTANDLARTLEIPDDPVRAADIIVRGRTRRIDLGQVNGHPFFNVASIGLAADLADRLSPEIKKRWGRLGYALSALRVVMSARPFSATIIEDSGERKVRTYQIAVGNGRHYGGGNVIHSGATIDDGHLDLYSLEMDNVWKLALMMASFRRGEHGAWQEVRTAKSREFDIRTSRPRNVNTDGDIVTQTPAHFLIRPDAVSVFVP
ncbi:lipid kinase, YegS/Rv2252/BmrU family [Devosia enhydra]|uniref:Lipid kinase, YegS/Rv2252/BmrU family n=1 Tax=Devosia enhydra TaxID=665118 RepID=A0A1K2HW68_9HYPH|nr:lipid kinase, YegS/Rv2252/BmrU family [Devosia enhydra]